MQSNLTNTLETWVLNSKASELKINYGPSQKDHSKFLVYMGINDTLESFIVKLRYIGRTMLTFVEPGI